MLIAWGVMMISSWRGDVATASSAAAEVVSYPHHHNQQRNDTSLQLALHVDMDARRRRRQRHRHRHRHRRRLLAVGNASNGTTPLYENLGTHFAYLYVGTPPQRVSVIIDTGSHHTAFPCVGCQCGRRTNPPFDPRKSNTSTILMCPGRRRCYFSQSYSEGSSWTAFKVRDMLRPGGEIVGSARGVGALNFEFGCQESETGLFRSQNVDGIMGMSAADDTLPHQLVAQRVTTTRTFALCFSVDGGVMTLGGVDPRLHVPGAVMKHARLMRGRGWYTVRLLDVALRPAPSSSSPSPSSSLSSSLLPRVAAVSLGASTQVWNGAKKGVIVDSGTTDTYLPQSVKETFERLFKQMADGMTYSNREIRLRKAQLDRLPTVVYTLEGIGGAPVEIECPPSSYAENVGGGKYAFRIYLTEPTGAVLGANFMTNHNVVFDIDNRRLGLVPATCVHEEDDAAKQQQLRGKGGKRKRPPKSFGAALLSGSFLRGND